MQYPIPHTIYFRNRPIIFLLLITLIGATIASLPFIKTTISIKSTGIIRPVQERTEIKPTITGIIDSLLIKEGDTVQQGQLLAIIKDNNSATKNAINEFELKQRLAFINDLQQLTTAKQLTTVALKTPLYRQQYQQLLSQLNEQQTVLKKVNHERAINNTLVKDKIITPKEQFDKEIEAEHLIANTQAIKSQQLSQWQNDLQRYQTELAQLTEQQQQIATDQKNHLVYATISGIVQNSHIHYTGGHITAGESLCLISPMGNLLGECFVSARDIGLLKTGQPARFQIDAFDYNYFGILSGTVQTIDNDFTLLENKPVFKVHCRFDSTQLLLKNGYKGDLKKGLTFQARFVVAERTLWQLLFDKATDWLNPAAAAILPQ